MRYESPWERLHEAALALADAASTDEEDYQRASDRFRKACIAYVMRLPRTPEGTRLDLHQVLEALQAQR